MGHADGFAIKLLPEQDGQQCSAQGTIGNSFQQLSIEGEHRSVLMACASAEAGTGVQCDCAAALAANKKPYLHAAGPRARYAGYRRERARGIGTRGQRRGLSKVKAHSSKQEVSMLSKE